ncbi:hypothetical protein [Mesorhizobium sangaii]|uniref:Uncharacterized protein n=1 Tax=Mesorhizobium sangaii TaxID=505389 RepID=A0A841PAV8_9HYPH|nr:hypothetical protein [Mesorhizobium sangaii]MBB6407452.1 hypothetical protein [Mesorhizobium sangaii]
MSDDPDFMCFNDLRYSGDGGLRAIAKVLQSGSPSKTFLALLAEHIDPNTQNSLTGVKLVIKRGKPNRPREKPNYELRNFVHRHCCIFDDNREAVLTVAQKKFGIGRTAFYEALRAVQSIEKHNPDLFATLKTAAYARRDANDPDFQPVR